MLATAAAVFHARGLFGAGNDLGLVFDGLNRYLGAHSGLIFGLALLASGVASSCVGTHVRPGGHAGLHPPPDPDLRAPGDHHDPGPGLIGVGFSPTRALVLSQVFLSFGIPFALIPLLVFTGSRS